MTVERSNDYLKSLVQELRKLPKETEWVEFKHNNDDPAEIGEYISALANSAALLGKASAYVVWGIDDETHDIIGTTFSPPNRKVGNEELENWLLRLLAPKINFRFFELQIEEYPISLLEIGAAFRHPVQFKNQEFIRVGSYKKKLKEFPEKERQLWRIFDYTPFERQMAVDHVAAADVLRLLDYPAYFDLLNLALPESRDAVLNALQSDELIVPDVAGKWNISNLGAVLLAKDLGDFHSLRRKAVRVILYKGEGRVETFREQIEPKGYAYGFEELIGYVLSLVPSNEVIGQALRKDIPMFPELAVRELVANAIIHQDFSQTGNGPMVEIFSKRMEITNPGAPLVKAERFLDSPPRSRNEMLASFMRRIGVCEERGSGVDKVVFQTELYQLPAPSFETPEGFTRAVLYAHKELRNMDNDDRVRACYLHASLRYVERSFMTNSSLRKRFGIDKRNSAVASRIIRETVDKGLIRPYDPNQGKKYAKYIPFWA